MWSMPRVLSSTLFSNKAQSPRVRLFWNVGGGGEICGDVKTKAVFESKVGQHFSTVVLGEEEITETGPCAIQ